MPAVTIESKSRDGDVSAKSYDELQRLVAVMVVVVDVSTHQQSRPQVVVLGLVDLESLVERILLVADGLRGRIAVLRRGLLQRILVGLLVLLISCVVILLVATVVGGLLSIVSISLLGRRRRRRWSRILLPVVVALAILGLARVVVPVGLTHGGGWLMRSRWGLVMDGVLFCFATAGIELEEGSHGQMTERGGRSKQATQNSTK